MQDMINTIVDILFQSIIFLNFFHLILGANMKTTILLLNHSTCMLKNEVEKIESILTGYNKHTGHTKTKEHYNLEIAHLRLLIAKNQDRILTLLS